MVECYLHQINIKLRQNEDTAKGESVYENFFAINILIRAHRNNSRVGPKRNLWFSVFMDIKN